jgi:DNA-directed RNA polymerase subunit F
MEVVQENCAMLSNYEVLSLLKDNKKAQNKKKRHQNTHVATILYSTLKYLEKTPCKDQSPEVVTAFMQALEAFNLTKAEKLQLLNLRPSTAVEIQLLIEESEERLSEDQIEQLLNTIAEYLGSEEVEEDGAN